MSPIPLSIEVPQVQTHLLAQRNIRRRTRNLPRNECPSSPWTFVIEQNPVARVHAIRLTIIYHNPIRVQFRATIWTAWVERRRLALGCFHNFSVQFRRRGLIKSDVLLESASADGSEEAEGAKSVDITGVFGHFEGDFNVGLCTKVVDF
jgi:hypothetical protein